jgi:hypothetical protein
MFEIELTAAQAAEAGRIEDVLRAKFGAEIRHISRLLASKDNRHLLGATEFAVRDAVHRIGAGAIEAALHERKKGGTSDPASCAGSAGRTPGSTATGAAR